jgi:acetate kinase
MSAAEVLVLNSGSSSVKFEVFDAATGLSTVAGGMVEQIGEPGGPADHDDALRSAASALRLDSADLVAIGHRVVHGGADFRAPTLITSGVIAAIEALTPLAPLHNPHNLAGIQVTRSIRGDLPQVAVFDTAFHATIPRFAAAYAIDRAVADREGVRRYGFHGTSHAYVSRATADLLGVPPESLNVITLHLGNGASACAVEGGRSVDTSMGLSPLEGLAMGTRPGDLDPGVLLHLLRNGFTTEQLDRLLNKESGLRGLCGENDMRRLLARRANGDQAATDAFDVYVYRIRKYIGAYCAVLGRVDAVTFTGGIGENSADVRAATTARLANFGIAVDPMRNDDPDAEGSRVISAPDSAVAVCVVPTDEEREIARQTLAVAGLR